MLLLQLTRTLHATQSSCEREREREGGRERARERESHTHTQHVQKHYVFVVGALEKQMAGGASQWQRGWLTKLKHVIQLPKLEN